MKTNSIDEHLEIQRLINEEKCQEEDAKLTSQSTQIIKSKQCPYLGIILAVISAIFFASISAIVKWLVNLHPVQLCVYRFAGIMLPAMPILTWQNENPFPKGNRLMQILRSFFRTTALMLIFYAFRHMPLGDASVLVFTVPVFVTIFARLFLKEPCGMFHITTICLTLVGVILISRTTFIFGSSSPVVGSDEQFVEMNMWGPVAALSAALFGAFDLILMRAFKGIHFSVMLVNYGMFSLILTVTTTWILGEFCLPQYGTERFLTVAIAVFSFGSQFLMTIAMKLEQASPLALARTSDIVFAFLLQIVFFQEVPNIYSILGAFFVTTSIQLNGIRTWVLALPETSTLRKRLYIFEL